MKLQPAGGSGFNRDLLQTILKDTPKGFDNDFKDFIHPPFIFVEKESLVGWDVFAKAVLC